jgi:hypothetical protein
MFWDWLFLCVPKCFILLDRIVHSNRVNNCCSALEHLFLCSLFSVIHLTLIVTAKYAREHFTCLFFYLIIQWLPFLISKIEVGNIFEFHCFLLFCSVRAWVHFSFIFSFWFDHAMTHASYCNCLYWKYYLGLLVLFLITAYLPKVGL